MSESEQNKLAIAEAMKALMRTMPIEKITTKEILEKAGVSRRSFYRYFKDKYDVMAYNYKLFVDRRADPAISHSYEELLYRLYRDSERSMTYLRNAFQYVGVNSFTEYVYEYSFDIVERITLDNRPEGLTESERLQLDVFCHGVSDMFVNWILGRYQLTPEEGAKALYGVMPPSLKHYWWKKKKG